MRSVLMKLRESNHLAPRMSVATILELDVYKRQAGNYAIGGFLAILIAAFVGAMLVMAVITFFSAIVRSHTAVSYTHLEVDIVMPVGKFFSEDYEGLCDDIQELKETCLLYTSRCV